VPTFEETVVATGRDTFHRLDELVDQHPVLTDKSGNEIHATCFESAPHVHGEPSPIETDPASSAMSGKVGRWTDTVNRLNTFTWFAFGLSTPTVHPKTLLARSGQWGVGGSCIMGFNQGGTSVLGRLKVGGVSYSLSAPCLPNNYYMVALRYNAGVIDLLLNAVVVATSGPVVTGDMEVGVSTEFRIGSSFSIIITQEESAGVDEVATGPALSDAELLEILESSQNSLSLKGFSNVIGSAILYSDLEPDPISFPFRHNWADPLIERISFLTNISQARSGPEESGQARIKPRREIEISQILRDDSERRKLRAKLWAHQDKKWFVPIREDFEQIQSALTSGVNILPITTQYKDLEVGSWIGLRQLNDQGQVVKSEELEITALNPSDVHTLTNTVNSYSAFTSFVYPVRRAYIPRTIPVKGHTDAVEELTLVGRLVAEDENAIPNRITPWTPTLTYQSFEVYDPVVWPSNDWSSVRDYDIDRDVDDIDFEVGTFGVESATPGAAEAIPYSFGLKGRDKIAQFLGWFYARAGSSNYLWVPTMQKDFKIVSAASANLTIEGTDYSDNYALAQSRRDLAFVYLNNTMIFRRVIGFSGSPNEILELNTTVPTQTNLRSVSLLKFCRLDGDTLEIAKITDNYWRFAWRFRELLTTPD
jgi:hypothetical protein